MTLGGDGRIYGGSDEIGILATVPPEYYKRLSQSFGVLRYNGNFETHIGNV
jgi:hypothetical protein